VFFEHAFDWCAVGEIDLLERETPFSTQDIQPRRLQRRTVLVVEIVEAEHRAAFGQQPARDMKADETRSSGDQYCLIRHRVLGKHFEPAVSSYFPLTRKRS